jgi:hypothetical protein
LAKFIFIFLFAALIISTAALATPPNTLEFGFARFVKVREGLYREPVRHVCIKDDKTGAYASAALFGDKIIFLDKEGHQTSRDTMPDTVGIRIAESVHGEYIYVFGSFKNKPGGFHRLYTFSGETILAEETDEPAGKVGLGIPLEGPKEFLMGGFGKVALINFDGQLVVEKELLNKDLLEDGDIFATADPEGSRIFVAANKFKLPVGQATFNRPILYGFNSRLNEIFADTLESLLVTSLKMSQNNKFLLMNEETDTSSLVWVLDLAGHKLKSFENPKRIVFGLKSDYLIELPHNAPAGVLSSTDWGDIYRPSISSPSSWIDAAISEDGTLGVMYNGDQIVLLDISKKSYAAVEFPFAFQTCRFYSRRAKLILTGEFGFEIYEMMH